MSLKDNTYLISAYDRSVSNYNEALHYGVTVQTLLLKLDSIQKKDYRTIDELKSDLIDVKEDAVQIHGYMQRTTERYGKMMNIFKRLIETDADITDVV